MASDTKLDQIFRGKSRSQPLGLTKDWPGTTAWINNNKFIAFSANHNKFYAHQN